MTQITDLNLCLSDASLDSILMDPLLSFWDELLMSADDVWTARGLVTPCCNSSLSNSRCNGWPGMLWLGPTERARKAFVIFHKMYDTGFPEFDDDTRFVAAVHELGHVLNLHHCDYNSPNDGLADDGRFVAVSLDHLLKHPRSCIEPGRSGDSWGTWSTDHDLVHGSCVENGGGVGDMRRCPSADPGLNLRVRPEKAVYVAGEPIRLEVTLTAEDVSAHAPYRYRSDRSLDPHLGYLRLWAGEHEEELEPLTPPVLAESALELEPIPKQARAAGIDVWYLLPQANLDGTRPFFVKATYAGLEDPSAMLCSPPVRIAPESSPDQQADRATAIDLFWSPDARRFAYFLGGDHLVAGVNGLRTISEHFPDSVVAPYANLALGANLSIAFHSYDPDTSRLTVRPPDYDAALSYLDLAERRREVLPDSYSLVLDEALSIAHQSLGEKAVLADPHAALEHYRRAERHLERISELGAGGATLSAVERAAAGRATATLEELRRKIMGVSP